MHFPSEHSTFHNSFICFLVGLHLRNSAKTNIFALLFTNNNAVLYTNICAFVDTNIVAGAN